MANKQADGWEFASHGRSDASNSSNNNAPYGAPIRQTERQTNLSPNDDDSAPSLLHGFHRIRQLEASLIRGHSHWNCCFRPPNPLPARIHIALLSRNSPPRPSLVLLGRRWQRFVDCQARINHTTNLEAALRSVK